jgi:carbamoyltransferase
MLICGLKLTHDGAVALVRDGVLEACIEIEKLGNNPRYSGIEDTACIPGILESIGIDASQVDRYAVDGWGGYDETALALQPRLEIGEGRNRLSARDGSTPFSVDVAQYEERTLEHSLLEPRFFFGLSMRGVSAPYQGYLHVADHLTSSYCTSPFAARGQNAYVLVWDGGMYPRLYFFDANRKAVENLGPLFLLVGNAYTIFAQHFSAFRVASGFAKDDLSIAGKVMAYIAKGTVREELLPIFDRVYRERYDHPMGFANIWARAVREELSDRYSEDDVLASFHEYLERLLVGKLAKKVARLQKPTRNLCIAGGCALNIKWNAAIRAAGLFDEVHVPPFPNDSGSAIGAACSAMIHETRRTRLEWDVYGGPVVGDAKPGPGWRASPCSVAELARVLHESNAPVTFLNGRAELGPRALGNRSILAAPTSPGMKDVLNRIKQREDYRPVSPICIEERAPAIFAPGTPDPWMLFDHRVRADWADRIPAVIHLDGTARLQTVNRRQNSVVASLIEAYAQLSGVPLLCNTSANYKGCGFFPDARSAAAWGQTRWIWCESTLYEREE